MSSDIWRVTTSDGVLIFSRQADDWIASTRPLTEAVVRHLAAGGPWPVMAQPPADVETEVMYALAVLYPDADFSKAPLDEFLPPPPDGAAI